MRSTNYETAEVAVESDYVVRGGESFEIEVLKR